MEVYGSLLSLSVKRLDCAQLKCRIDDRKERFCDMPDAIDYVGIRRLSVFIEDCIDESIRGVTEKMRNYQMFNRIPNRHMWTKLFKQFVYDDVNKVMNYFMHKGALLQFSIKTPLLFKPKNSPFNLVVHIIFTDKPKPHERVMIVRKVLAPNRPKKSNLPQSH